MDRALDLGSWNVSEEFVHDYLEAVDDVLPTYSIYGLVPPVALAARALGSLLERLHLQPGAIHSVQEITSHRAVPFGQSVVGAASVGQPKRRGGLEFITVAVELKNSNGDSALSSKSTVLVVDPDYQPAASKEQEESGARSQPQIASDPNRGNDATKVLPRVTKTITPERLKAYAEVSGDRNPIHLDAEFAAGTQFGGIIAHGMLTLAFISEMMAAEFDRAWLESGVLKVRFKGAAYLGDTVVTNGRVDKEEPVGRARRLGCAVGVSNQVTGSELVTGNASLVV